MKNLAMMFLIFVSLFMLGTTAALAQEATEEAAPTALEQFCADLQAQITAQGPYAPYTTREQIQRADPWFVAGEAIYTEANDADDLLQAALEAAGEGEIGYGAVELADEYALWQYVTWFNNDTAEVSWRIDALIGGLYVNREMADGDRAVYYYLKFADHYMRGELGYFYQLVEVVSQFPELWGPYDFAFPDALYFVDNTWNESYEDIAERYLWWHGQNPAVEPGHYLPWLRTACPNLVWPETETSS